MRRACSREVRGCPESFSIASQCSPVRADITRAGTGPVARSPRRPPAARARRATRRGPRGHEGRSRRSAEARSGRARSGRAGRAARARERARSSPRPGRVATATRARSSTASGSFQRRKPASWSAPTSSSGSSHSDARSMSIVRGCSSILTSSPGNAARPARGASSTGVAHLLVLRVRRDEDDELVEPEAPLGLACERDVPEVRRVEGAAEDPGDHCELEGLGLALDLDLGARLDTGRAESLLELLAAGRPSGHAVAAVGAQDPEAAASGPRPVDEELGQPVVVRRRRLGLRARARTARASARRSPHR